MLDTVQPCVLPKCDYSITMPHVVRSCVLSKGDDNMPCLTSSHRMYCPDGEEYMGRPTLSDRVCFPLVKFAFRARCHLTVCAAQGPYEHTTPDVV